MKIFSVIKTALVLGALTAAGLVAQTGTAHATGNWCAEAGGRGGYSNCGYATFRQCMASIRGVGGTCRPNPRVETDVVETPYGYRVYRRVYR
ncbi:MAG: DUF3551 domain-containing protein [Variibacter sp.]|nr:DUF3551 domain-containing protein [Variibacter sp.]